jgi:hypothetical protein
MTSLPAKCSHKIQDAKGSNQYERLITCRACEKVMARISMQCNVSLLENALERVSKNVGDAEKASGESEGSAGNGNGNGGADGSGAGGRTAGGMGRGNGGVRSGRGGGRAGGSGTGAGSVSVSVSVSVSGSPKRGIGKVSTAGFTGYSGAAEFNDAADGDAVGGAECNDAADCDQGFQVIGE